MNILNKLADQAILPLFYHADPEVSVHLLRALYAAGIRVVEYTNRGASALENFKRLKEAQVNEMSNLSIGIGTIRDEKTAEMFVSAGADFLISPVVNAGVAGVARREGLLWVPGCMTPTEINTAAEYGAEFVKIFPANLLGPEFIRSVKELFPGLLFMPTGGVDTTYENLSEWFSAGVFAVGMGSRLISPDILAQNDYELLRTRTADAMIVASGCRGAVTVVGSEQGH